MRKILFLEDRPERQRIFLPIGENDVSVLRNMQNIVMPELEDCKITISNINSNKNFIIEGISLIVIHESSLTVQGLRFLNKTCKENNIGAILFSGGISQTAFNNEDYDMLYVNSSDLYTERFIPFLEKYKNDSSTHLLELINPNWRISYWFLLRQLLNTKEIEEKSNNPDSDRIDVLEDKIENASKVLGIDLSQLNSNTDSLNKEIKKLLL